MLRLFYGDDRVGMEAAVAEITAGMEPSMAAANVSRADGATVDLQQLAGASRSMPFFTAKRVIVVQRLGERLRSAGKDAAAEFVNAVRDLPESTELIVLEPELTRDTHQHPLHALAIVKGKGELRQFALAGAGDTGLWIGEHARAQGIEIGRDAAEELHRRVGDDALRLQAEIGKLATYCLGAERIEAADVRELVAASTESTVFELVDAVGRREAARALHLAQDLLGRQAEPAARLLAMVGRQFRLLTMVKDLLAAHASPAQIASEVEAAPWLVRRLTEQSHHFTLPELERALEATLAADFAIKTGGGGEEGVVLQLVADLTLDQ